MRLQAHLVLVAAVWFAALIAAGCARTGVGGTSGTGGSGGAPDGGPDGSACVANGWTDVAAGLYVTCARDNCGMAWCWGEGSSGSSTPELVSGIGPTLLVATGIGTCAVTTDRALWCGLFPDFLSPTEMSELDHQVTSLASGGYTHSMGASPFVCAGLEDRSIWCWDGLSPTFEREFELPRPAVLIAAGASGMCAIDASGALWCWYFESEPSPVEVALPARVISVAVGQSHRCAVTAGNELWCWGSNENGQLLTDGGVTSVPVHVASNIQSVAAADVHTCVLRLDGSVWCWGGNPHGQLGNGSSKDSRVPVQVTALGTGTTAITAGGDHTCARKVDGTLWCWGDNGGGQLGDGTTTDRTQPVQVAMP